jgi:hypothetical protein
MGEACTNFALATFRLIVKQDSTKIGLFMPKSMLDFVVDRLYGCDLNEAAEVSGYSKWTLMKIRQREIPNPGIKGIEALWHHFQKKEVKRLRAK